jgi:hypothetical protein
MRRADSALPLAFGRSRHDLVAGLDARAVVRHGRRRECTRPDVNSFIDNPASAAASPTAGPRTEKVQRVSRTQKKNGSPKSSASEANALGAYSPSAARLRPACGAFMVQFRPAMSVSMSFSTAMRIASFTSRRRVRPCSTESKILTSPLRCFITTLLSEVC